MVPFCCREDHVDAIAVTGLKWIMEGGGGGGESPRIRNNNTQINVDDFGEISRPHFPPEEIEAPPSAYVERLSPASFDRKYNFHSNVRVPQLIIRL